MDHYIDIQLLPDPEFASPVLMNALYAKLHRVLVQLECADVGLSFPDYREGGAKLGEKMRLHGDLQRLQGLMDSNWLTGMHDHVRAGSVLKVPDSAQVLSVRRVQAKSSAERIRRRQMRRHGLTQEEALVQIPDSLEKRLKLPFITLKSQSTEQVFRLFIRQEKTERWVPGCFNSYGLSAEATVPFF